MNNVHPVYRIIFISFLIFFVFKNCENNSKVRNYKEKISDDKIDSKVQIKGEDRQFEVLEWKIPDGWIEKKGSGFRLATFSIQSSEKEATCTIIPLRGDGGGLKPNVLRWLNQLGIGMDSGDELNRFISKQKKFKTSGNLSALFVDFTPLTHLKSDISMFVSVVSLQDTTVFVKMRGEKSFLIKNRDKFVSLCRSLKIRL